MGEIYSDIFLCVIRSKTSQIIKKICRRAGQGKGQCPTHFSQATGETRLFRRTLTCPLYRGRKGRFRELLKAALLLL